MDLQSGTEVMQKCAIIYGRKFDPRTWRNWKRQCRIEPKTPQQGDWLTPFETKKLIALAFLKRQNPHGSYTYGQILLEMSRPDKQDWLIAIAKAPNNTLIQPCYGRDLPKVIKQLTGCAVSQRRLYRIAERNRREFSLSAWYSPRQINWWVQMISPNFA
jgi:hypothetical protein